MIKILSKIHQYLSKLCFIMILLLAVISLFPSAAVSAGSLVPISAPGDIILAPNAISDSMTVTWWDAPTVTADYLRYSKNADMSGSTTVMAILKKNDLKNGYSAFEASMSGLNASTVYYYQVGAVRSGWSEVKTFTTAAAGSKDCSFIYLGDVQYNNFNTANADYEAWGQLITNAKNKFPDLAFALLGGDMVEQGQSSSCWQMFLDQATKVFAQMPMLSISGNHENNSTSGKPELYLQLQALPQNGPSGFQEEFYSYDYGSNLHISALNSSIFLGEQAMTETDFAAIKQWLKADLAANSGKWRIIVMHHPAYAVVSDKTADKVLAQWVPLFEETKVDLVLCGHQHVYMRTHPMMKGAISEKEGIVYVMGNSGSKFYTSQEVAHSAKMIANTSTYQIINVSNDNLRLVTYDAAGGELDSVTILPKTSTTHPIPPSPPGIAGDINNDGMVDMADVGKIISAILICDYQNMLMDINHDGVINICDAHALALLCP